MIRHILEDEYIVVQTVEVAFICYLLFIIYYF